MAPPSKRRRPQIPTPTPSLDHMFESALSLPDPSLPFVLSLERILDATPLPSDQYLLLSNATRLASALLNVATRSSRKLAASHNSSAWPLTADLTIKVFSMLDSESVCCAAAACLLFSRCASDPLCYANIDLTRSSTVPKVTKSVVSTMIQRAGNNLSSIKLGRLPQDMGRLDENKSPLTGSCLAALDWNGGVAGLLLRRLHLYNLRMQYWDRDFCSTLSACQSLVELKIVGLDVGLVDISKTIHEHCHFIEHLHLEVRADKYRIISDSEALEIKILIKKCPLLSFLAIRGYTIDDDLISVLVKEAFGLKSLDLSGSRKFSGIFLCDLCNGDSANSLETLILRECGDLKAESVSIFLSAILRGDWKALRYVDISNNVGLVLGDNWAKRRRRCAIEVSHILKGRPDIRLVACYPPGICFYEDRTSPPLPRSGF